jgi:hypothetical protein
MPLQTSIKPLVSEEVACELLSLSLDDLLWLTATEQLSPLFIRGRRLFEVARLMSSFRSTNLCNRGQPMSKTTENHAAFKAFA